MQTHAQSVLDQFDPQAQAYLTSQAHARGPDLAHASMLVNSVAEPIGSALDVGCGAGHLSFALAQSVARLIALDPSPNMLATVARAAADRGLTQIQTLQGSAESLPFADGDFGLVCTRYSAHHWARLAPALQEMRRVMSAHGFLLIIDVLAAQDPLVDTHLQTLELLRDPSHVRNRSVEEWRSQLTAAGFTQIEHVDWPLRLAFDAWIQRMRTPLERTAVIRSLQQAAPREVQQALRFESDGSFSVRTGLFWARPAD